MDCGDKCAKWLLFCFNFIFFLSGIAIITVGSIVTVNEAEYVSLIGSEEFTLSVVMIVVGCIVTIISFFGCCGAMKNNTCMLYTFSVLLIVIFLAEVAGSIVAFVYQDQITDKVTKNMINTMPDYYTDDQIKKEWDNMQTELGCCGTSGPEDWNNVEPMVCSCCKSGCEDTSGCIWGNTDSYYSQGCINQVTDDIATYAWAIAGVALGVAIIQLFGIGIACCLASSLKRQNRIH